MPFTYWARIDSSSANNPALNLTGDPAFQFTLINEDISGNPGDFLLDQPSPIGPDPDTVIEIGGTTYEFTVQFTGNLPTLKKDGAQQVPDQFEGERVIVLTVIDYPSAGTDTRIFFMPDATATEADLNAFGNGAIDIQNVNNNPPTTTICFVSGTRLATPQGEVAVEDLAAGDLVDTVDHGALPILWIGETEHTWPGSPDKILPIRIAAGALGPNRPNADLVVSPQHRMLLRFDGLARRFGTPEVLLPAIGMTGCRQVRRMVGRKRARYFHILLPRHAIVWANGCETESFYPGETALKALAPAHRRRIFDLFPGLARGTHEGYGPLARQTLTRRQGEAMLSRLKLPAALQCPAEPGAAAAAAA